MIAPDCHTAMWGGLSPKIVFDRIAAAQDKLFGGADRRELLAASRLIGRVVFFPNLEALTVKMCFDTEAGCESELPA